MEKKTTPQKPGKRAEDRETRLKAALKANLARRKAQTRGRKAPDEAETPEQKDN
ncbi:hypothetical protein [Roseovarius sp. MMSF_3281]|uniref:hypothetical protein n=1 Tax=Roseovarius sp. MMSF_3281 TaxID=3046694 RepID=UPI00273FFC69|nr:hypothetical protein [Roseovarius sp. MMSF_3281]